VKTPFAIALFYADKAWIVEISQSIACLLNADRAPAAALKGDTTCLKTSFRPAKLTRQQSERISPPES